MDQNPLFTTIDAVGLELGDVVRHIIDNRQVYAIAENPFEGSSRRVGN